MGKRKGPRRDFSCNRLNSAAQQNSHNRAIVQTDLVISHKSSAPRSRNRLQFVAPYKHAREISVKRDLRIRFFHPWQTWLGSRSVQFPVPDGGGKLREQTKKTGRLRRV